MNKTYTVHHQHGTGEVPQHSIWITESENHEDIILELDADEYRVRRKDGSDTPLSALSDQEIVGALIEDEKLP